MPDDPIAAVSFAALDFTAATSAIFLYTNPSHLPLSLPFLFASLGFAVSSAAINAILPDSPIEMTKNAYQVRKPGSFDAINVMASTLSPSLSGHCAVALPHKSMIYSPLPLTVLQLACPLPLCPHVASTPVLCPCFLPLAPILELGRVLPLGHLLLPQVLLLHWVPVLGRVILCCPFRLLPWTFSLVPSLPTKTPSPLSWPPLALLAIGFAFVPSLPTKTLSPLSWPPLALLAIGFALVPSLPTKTLSPLFWPPLDSHVVGFSPS